ncbi:hypothetical protein MKEN_00631900 [Mycena kentingensis (nom. inval.)]|nr:hypothetical protein MKEN_00631900 [Mycena kentingensis (nom. inval.)]
MSHRLPSMRAFAAYTLDPIACVDADVLADPIALQQLQSMTCKSYVGLVGDPLGFYLDKAPYNAFTFYFIRSGHPDAVPEKGITSAMAHPLLGLNTDNPLQHIFGRSPLLLVDGARLPYNVPDLHLSQNRSVDLRCHTRHEDRPPGWALTDDEYDRFWMDFHMDSHTASHLEPAREGSVQVPSQLHSREGVSNSSLPSQKLAVRVENHESAHSDDAVEAEGVDDLKDEILAELLPDLSPAAVEDTDIIPTGTFTHDLVVASYSPRLPVLTRC